MASAFKCDRCGRYMDKTNTTIFPKVAKSWVNGGYGHHEFYDLCDKCQKDLELFMSNTPVMVHE